MLRELHPDLLFCIDEPMPKFGLDMGARLTIARLRNGDLWVHAPFAIVDEDEIAIRARGEVKHIVVPNAFHFTEVGEFTRRFPAAMVWAPPELGAKLRDVPHFPLRSMPPEWSVDFDGLLFDAPLLMREWVFCHRASQTLLLTDLSFNIPRPRNPRGRIMARLMDAGRGFKPGRAEQIAIRLGQTKRAREQLNTIANWDFERITMAHGAIIERDGQRALKRAFSWL